MISQKEIRLIFNILQKDHQPTMLEQFKDYTPFQKVVMTLLSSRTKDSTTIPIVRKLFQKYPRPNNFVILQPKLLEKEIYKIGFHTVKAKHIIELSKIWIEKYSQKDPDTFTKLISLPGVGPKTANCVLNYAFNKPAIAVDVHVHRISHRLGWVKTKTPEKTELALQKIVPKELWVKVNELLVDHGQRVCQPLKPKCSECKVRKYCDYPRCPQ